MHAVQSNLYDAELAELMEHYIYTTRPLPGTIFSCLWKCLLDYLQLLQEERCVNVLFKTFLEKDENDAIVAVWRCRVDRMIFATATASQAQEAVEKNAQPKKQRHRSNGAGKLNGAGHKNSQK